MISKIVRKVINKLNYRGYLRSYSQEGEDMILNGLLDSKEKGFYVDVGAHHPTRFSNTYFFYQRGWWGINIDAMPGSMVLFQKLRKKDHNIEAAISDEYKELTYHIFNETAINGFDSQLSQTRNSGDYKITSNILLKTKRLSDILDEHVLDGQRIDFMSIDVEGLELNVLKSNDWNKYKPHIILVEELDFDCTNPGKSKINFFLSLLGYSLVARTPRTSFFRLNSLK